MPKKRIPFRYREEPLWRAKVYDISLGGRDRKTGKPVRVCKVIWEGHGSVSPSEARKIAASLITAAEKAERLSKKYAKRWAVITKF